MEKISGLVDVWDNGATTPEDMNIEDTIRFKNLTGANWVVHSKWTYRGRIYQIAEYARPLFDESGVLHFENNDIESRRIIVRNGDSTIRTIIAVPRLSEASKPEKGYLCLPPSPAHWGGIEWGCEGNDGDTDYLFEFDWNSGQLLRYVRPPLPW